MIDDLDAAGLVALGQIIDGGHARTKVHLETRVFLEKLPHPVDMLAIHQQCGLLGRRCGIDDLNLRGRHGLRGDFLDFLNRFHLGLLDILHRDVAVIAWRLPHFAIGRRLQIMFAESGNRVLGASFLSYQRGRWPFSRCWFAILRCNS